MRETTKRDLTPELRSVFAVIADFLIPPYKDLPAASAAEIADAALDKVLEARPDLLEAVVRGLRASEGKSGEKAAKDLNRDDSEAFDAISTAVSGGYLMDPGIRDLIGYPGQESIETPDPYAPPSYVTDGTLKRVFERGPIYVPTPGLEAKPYPEKIAKDLK